MQKSIKFLSAYDPEPMTMDFFEWVALGYTVTVGLIFLAGFLLEVL